jgi:hypothetical protein
MGFVRNAVAGAWVMQVAFIQGTSGAFIEIRPRVCVCPGELSTSGTPLGVTVWYLTDWFYVGLTIIVFAVLLLILKGIETFER